MYLYVCFVMEEEPFKYSTKIKCSNAFFQLTQTI